MGKIAWRAGNMLNPLPAVMVTTLDKDGKPNIITVAWAGTVCSDPAMVSISVRPSRYSYIALKERREFVINLVSEELTAAMDTCGVKSGRDVDKFALCGLHPEASDKIGTPGIREAPVSIECRVRDILPLGSHDLFLAEVIAVNVEERYLKEDGRFALEEARLVAYDHGEYRALGKKLGSFGYSVRKKKRRKAGKKAC